MAVLRFGKQVCSGIARVSINDNPSNSDYGVINSIGYAGQLISIPFKKCESIRVECKSNLQTLDCDNCGIVYGDIDYAKVSNTLRVEGNVINFNNARNSIYADKYIKVCYGAERRKREGYNINTKSKVIHIDGDLLGLKSNITNQSLEVVVFGNVKEANIANCLDVKGIVKGCNVGNMIYCSMGTNHR